MKEIRNNETINSNNDLRKIEGYCVVFNSRSKDLGGFIETIKPNSITNETIQNSDIYFLLNHNVDRGILARSNKGEGSLKLEIDEKGLKFSFDCPDTALGNEVYQGIKRGDINKCSFAFTVADDTYSKEPDGTILRTINQIERLYDCSIVYNPAYLETTVDLRGLEAFLNDSNEDNNEDNIINPVKEEKRKDEDLNGSNEENEEIKESDSKEVERKEEKSDVTNETSDSDEEDSEEKTDESEKEKKECVESKKEEERKENINSNKEIRNNPNSKINFHSAMNKKFSLINTINDVVNNRNFNDTSLEVITRSKEIATKQGINVGSSQIVLSGNLNEEQRAVANPNGILAQEATYGAEAVPSEIFDFTGKLRDKMVLSQAGARYITVNSNLDFVDYSGSLVGWGDEIEEAQDGSGKWSIKRLEAKRICAVLPISRTWLEQSDSSAEELLREDIVKAISEELQRTILGDEIGTDKKPQGLMYNVATDASSFEYADAVNIEEYLESKNFNTDGAVWVLSPSAKAVMRKTPMDAGSGRFVLENKEVLGVPSYSTSSMIPNGAIYGDFSELIIANYNAMSILVDPYTLSAKNQIRLVVNYYVNYILRREDALVKRVIKA